jgi:hypothetical protein
MTEKELTSLIDSVTEDMISHKTDLMKESIKSVENISGNITANSAFKMMDFCMTECLQMNALAIRQILLKIPGLIDQ